MTSYSTAFVRLKIGGAEPTTWDAVPRAENVALFVDNILAKLPCRLGHCDAAQLRVYQATRDSEERPTTPVLMGYTGLPGGDSSECFFWVEAPAKSADPARVSAFAPSPVPG